MSLSVAVETGPNCPPIDAMVSIPTSWQRIARTAAANAAGEAVVDYGAPETPHVWQIEQLAVIAPVGTTFTAAGLYVGELVDADLHDRTEEAFAVADYPRPILVETGRRVRVRWTGLPAGTQVTGRLQYVVAQLRRGTVRV